MKTVIQKTTPSAFSFSNVMATTQGQPLLLSVMSHLADRLHIKIDYMSESNSLERDISLIIKQDDKDLMVAALESDVSALSAEQVQVLTSFAEMARNADRKIFLSYEDVEKLFNTINH